MLKHTIVFFVIALFFLGIPFSQVDACTSFLLKTDIGLYFAHSLNQGNLKNVPGFIFINQRDTWKRGYSWENLLKVKQDVAPSLFWRSKFGSVTFNPVGKEFPDGGDE